MMMMWILQLLILKLITLIFDEGYVPNALIEDHVLVTNDMELSSTLDDYDISFDTSTMFFLSKSDLFSN
jgi:hypothetical protein